MLIHVLRAALFVAVFFTSFRALAGVPTATTSPATGITATQAQLNGAGNPSGEATTGWFRIATTTPGTCNDTFGTRVPATGGTDLGAGSASVPYSITAIGLSPGTTYYFCAIVSNGSGTAFGSVLSFTTLAPPIVTTNAPTSVASTSANLEGTANPSGSSGTGWFRYSPTDPGTCNDTFGTRAPSSGGSALGSGTSPVNYSRSIVGLIPATTYYYCAIASNSYGTAYGAVVSFTTPAEVPSVTTGSATAITSTTATLNGSANPGGVVATAWFRYSSVYPGSCNDTFGTRAPATGGSSLGPGTTPLAYAQPLTGLTANTTYYYCAIASNTAGTGFGALLQFTTPAPPTVTTTAASSVTISSAQLNGNANPNNAATTGWFRYSLTDPGTCNDSFGSRAPTTGGTNLGAGSTAQGYLQSISGLSPATTYYFCAIAQNSEGMSFGAVLTFTTPTTPTVTTSAATPVGSTTATLNGSGNPGGATTTGWFRYSTTSPGTCNDSFGARAPSSGGTNLGAGTSSVNFSQGLASLSPGTTYYYCAIVQNAYGSAYGAVLSFTTLPSAPTVSTNGASALGGTSATLNGSANPGGGATTGWFRYATSSPGTCNDSFGTRAPASGGSSLGSGTSNVPFSQGITGLVPGTTYYFCAIAQNSGGMGFGGVTTFTTPLPPTVTTTAASSVTNSAAQLNGQGIPNGGSTTGWFRYSTTNPGACDDAFGSRAPSTGGSGLGSGYGVQGFSQGISGLSQGTTYYYCAIASSAEGIAFGAIMSFTTAAAPTVTTDPATTITASSAVLNGTGNPGGASTSGWFRYSTASPGTCNDSFGTRLPSSSSSNLGAGTSNTTYSQTASGLLPGTTYYFCAIVSNTYGYAYGAVLSFTTQPVAPTVFTGGVPVLGGTSATLGGSATPGGAATTAWLRYDTTSPGACNDTFGTRAPASGGSSLGAGTGNINFTQPITGLTPATTYFYCAIAQNSVGMGFGTISSFTTPSPPAVTTSAATSITNSSAQLNGSGIPYGSSTTGYFRYALTDPGTCDDVFGSRAPASGGTALGSGTSAQGFSQGISGLSQGTTYYFCAIAQSAEGTAFGAVMTFTTATPPTVATAAATAITSSSATLNGAGNPGGASTTGWFRYSTTNPGFCNDSFGTRAPSSGGTNLGAGTSSVDFTRSISTLQPGTTYYYCAIVQNAYGYAYGAVLSFTTLPTAPTVSVNGVTSLLGASATLNGAANPGGGATTGWFRYAPASPGSCNDTFGTRAPASGGSSLGAGTSNVPFSQGITGLTPGATYYYCAIAQNSGGLGVSNVGSFTTPLPPTVTTTAASGITNSGAQLNGAGIPNGATTTGYFRYSTTNPTTCDDVFGSRAPASGGTGLGSGYSGQSFSQTISGLSQGTTYYYCAIAQSSEGTALGNVLSFTTAAAPTVTTSPATSITASSAVLNGNGNPGGATTTGWFRYSATSPGTCNDSFGTRVPSSGGTDLGAGTTGVDFSRSLTGLQPGTTYYYCAIVLNAYAYAYGAVLSFTTQPVAPTVTTGGATALTGTSATLNGSGNPGGAATTGWFRYSAASPGSCNDTFGTRAPATGGSSLGSGTSNTNFSQPISGLTPATTYYYCAIAQNSVGLTLGSLQTFVTPSPPTTTTNAASSVTNVSAQLNGSGIPNGAATTGYFRYSLTDPGTCDDVFGSRAPTTGGTNLGSGTTAQSFFQSVSGLSPGTTYYFCAIAQSAEGTAFGAVLTFTTPTPPTVTTVAAAPIGSTTATLNGSGNPGGATTTGWFRYSASNPGACNDSFGTRAPSSGGSNLGSGTTSANFSQAISSLTPGTTYYYCAIVQNAYGYAYGAVLSFTTNATAPSVSTSSATAITPSTATLNGSANPSGATTTGWFRYATASPGTCNDSFGTRAPATGGSGLGAGTSSVNFNQALTGLNPGTTYYYCALAQNAVGLSVGSVLTFTTTTPPTVTTLAATPVTATTATLNGVVNPNGFATTGWFRYSTTNPGACDTTFGTATTATGLGAGTSGVALAHPISGLAPATTYYFCAIAQSSIGTSLGAVLSFTTPAAPPSVTTVAASALLDTSATLNATVNPNGSATTVWFRYSATSPGTCNDSFGTRAPATGGADIGGGNTPVDVPQPITGLTAGTTYYFCALASSGVGNSVGAVLTFTTASAPTVTTSAASAVTNTGATLNGTANPNQSATTGWFRYSTTSPGACNDTFGTRAPASGGSSLGSGSSAAAFSQPLTGLGSATTYYFCAIAQNAVGTSFGNVLTFTTSASPSVTTVAASAITATGATLNGSANPNLLAATGWFRMSTTDPGTCNDTFGTRYPSSGGTALGAGSSPVNYLQSPTGLTAGTTYFYCAIASNSAGTGFGAVMSFTTAAAPSVTTLGASSVTTSSAQLNGSANPNLLNATGWFRYSTTSPGTCNDTFGTRAPSSGGTPLGSGSSPIPYVQAISGLAQGTTYYYCAIASNTQGTRVGAVLSFTTPSAPTVTTVAASAITSTDATLNGSANPAGLAATGWFRYSTTSPGTCNDTFGTRAPASGGTDLGSGSTAVAFSEPITGLSAGTTYYVCAIGQNSVGTAFGAVLSFTTPSLPVVSTSAASAVASTSATLNGSANPGLSATTGWFRYDTTSPGTCNDSFGTRAPASGGSSLGAGSSAVAFAQPITGLSSATTYYFCAIAQNAVGTSFGTVLSFTTTAAPSVTTVAASAITSTGATLNGSANPNLLTSTGWFRYSATNPGTCSDTFGTRAPVTGGTALGAGSSAVAYAQSITGLTAGTTYYYCAIASNSVGLGFGAVMSFTTAAPPTVTTVAATSVASNGATLNGAANPNQLTATGWFRYSTTSPGTCNDTFGTRAPASGGAALGNGTSPVDYSQALTGLNPATTYYFCAIASNSQGTRFGAVMSFTTTSVPTVVTTAATAVTSNGATLNGTANPNNQAATGWFRYSTTSPGTCNDTFGTRAPASGETSLGSGGSAVPYSQAIGGLTPATTYYFCAIAQNPIGNGYGAVLSFTTPAAPVVVSVAASGVGSTGATLNGSGNPNLDATTGWFRYSAIDPGTCDDNFGTRAPASGGSALGAGSTAVAFSQTLTGLASGTTYYYCAIAQNSVGTSFGNVLTFTTTAPPTVATNPASAIGSTGATLNGSANPSLLAATGWFRYSTTSPGTCNDTFGTRAPLTGGTALGNGSSAVAYAQAITGLTPATTYYYCAIASNAAGTGVGLVQTFTTPAAPSVVTAPATAVGSTDATLEGAANPNFDAATGWYRFSATDPGACNDTFGTRAPASGGAALGSGSTPVAFSQPLTGLTPATTYYYCAIASNAVGTGFGAVLSFTTTGAPTVTTSAATGVGSAAATLHGSGDPNLVDATGWFRYSATDPGACNDTFGTRAPATGGTALGNGSSAVSFTQSLTGLTPGTTYYFCAIASNAVGTGVGAVMSFTTTAAPSVTTDAATLVLSNGATLNGTGVANLDAATGWFRYSATDPGACDDAFGTRAPLTGGSDLGAGSTAVAFSQAVGGLAPATTYYYCAIAQNAVGTSFGAVLSFTTSAEPSVITKAATNLTSTGATLNGTGAPNLSATTGWFRYDTTDPGSCDDTFGTRLPTTGGTSLGAGSLPVDFNQALTGLSPTTTYYFCAIAQNTSGTAFGEVLSFTTPADPPDVTTEAPTAVLATSATLNGTAVPGGDPTTGWFRWDVTDPGACNDTFGTRAPTTGGSDLGSGFTAVPFSQQLTGLTPWTTIYYCAIAQNAEGTRFGEIVSFIPGAEAPVVTTEDATAVKSDGATLEGTADPNGGETTGWFRFGDVDPGTCDDSFGTRAPETGGVAVGAADAATPFNLAITGLEPNSTYFYCAAASNAGGAAFGQVRSFKTQEVPPAVTTLEAAVTDKGEVTLNGSANPYGLESTGWFRFANAAPSACDDSFGTRVPASGATSLGAGREAVPFSEAAPELEGGTYYYCAIAENGAGLAFGEVLSFEVPETEKPAPKEEAGCGCRAVGSDDRGGAGAVIALGALALLALRRRRAG